MVSVTIYVEGGGDTNSLKTKCRQGFSEFFKKLDIKLKIIACGSRNNAFKDFCTGLKNAKKDEHCLLLVDSEEPIISNNVWQHVSDWQKPDRATEEHLHFMVECMEAWFMADKQTLISYYGLGFNQNALSQNAKIEDISKRDLYNTLNSATRKTAKGSYSKSGHSFDILSKIDARKVIANSPYAQRLLDTLQNPSKFLTLSR